MPLSYGINSGYKDHLSWNAQVEDWRRKPFSQSLSGTSGLKLCMAVLGASLNFGDRPPKNIAALILLAEAQDVDNALGQHYHGQDGVEL